MFKRTSLPHFGPSDFMGGESSPGGARSEKYDNKYQQWSEDNQRRLDRGAQKYSKDRGKYFQSKLTSMCRPRHTHKPPATTFDTETGSWGMPAIENFVSLLYKQRSDWLNPDKIDKIELAHAVREVLDKNPEAAVDAYLNALHFPKTQGEIGDDRANGAGYYAHRWKTIAADSASGLIGSLVPFVASHEAVATLHLLRDVLALLQLRFGLTTGWERAAHFRDRENAAASMVAKQTIDILLNAPAPMEAARIARELEKIAPQLESALKAAIDDADPILLRELGPRIEAFEKDIDLIKAHLYLKNADFQGEKSSMKYRTASNAVKLIGAGAAAGVGSKTGPVGGGIVYAAGFALSLVPHLIYHFKDAGVQDARDKGMTQIQNNVKLVNQWINTNEYAAGEIAQIYDDFINHKISEQECRTALANAFNMKAVPDLVEVMGGVQMRVAKQLLTGKLSKALRKMVAANARVRDTGRYHPFHRRYQRKAARQEEKAMRLFEDYYRLQLADFYLTQALAVDDEKSLTGLLDQASQAFHEIQDEDMRTLLASKSLQKQGDVMGLARILNRDESFKYSISNAACQVFGMAAIGADIGRSTHAAVNYMTGIEHAPDRDYVASAAAAVGANVNYAITAQRVNFAKAYGGKKAELSTDASHLQKSEQEVNEIYFSLVQPDESKTSLKAALAQIKRNGATPAKLKINGDLEVNGKSFEYEVDFRKTQAFYDEHETAKSLMDKMRLKTEEAWIGLRLFCVGLRALGTDGAKKKLKATKPLRTEISRLKPHMREQVRKDTFAVLARSLNSLSTEASARLVQMDMQGFMRFLNSGLAEPLNTRVYRTNGKAAASPAAVADWMNECAANCNQLVLRTGDGYFVVASRAGIGQEWQVEDDGEMTGLRDFIKDRENRIAEIGVIPFTSRIDLRARLEKLDEQLRLGDMTPKVSSAKTDIRNSARW